MCFNIWSPVDCKKEEVKYFSFSTDRELDPTNRKSQTQFSAEVYFNLISSKMFRVSLKFLHIQKGNPIHILKTFERLVCYSLWNLRGFVPSNYTRFYRCLNYNQGLVELVSASRSTRKNDLKPLSRVSKSQSRVCLCCCKSKKRRSPWIQSLYIVVSVSYYMR